MRQLAWADVPDAKRSPILATATRDLTVIWILIPGEGWQSYVLDLHQDTVLDVAFQPQTGLLASLSEDGWILLWQAAVEPAQVLEGAYGGFSCLSWHSTGEYLAAGGQQGEVLVWALCPDAKQRLFSATGGAIASLGSLLPAFGETIRCPCCDRSIPALVLTNAYLCPRHGLF